MAAQDDHNMDLDLTVNYRRKAEQSEGPKTYESRFFSFFFLLSCKSYCHSSVK